MTLQVESEKRILESFLKERALDSSSCGIIITDPSLPDHPIIYANLAFYALTGYSPAEVLGRNCRFLQNSETDRAAIQRIRDAVKEGSDVHVLLRNLRKDKTHFWNDLFVAPVKDAEGHVTHFVGVQTDVTARVEAQNALAASRASFSSLVEKNIEGLIVIADPDATVLFANASAGTLLGERLIGGRPWSIERPKHGQEWIIPITRLSGEAGEGSLQITPTDWNGQKASLIVVTDVTERRRTLAHLIQSEKLSAIGQMAAGIVHELNSPMGVIMGFAQALARRTPEGQDKEALKAIERESLRCQELVRSLLTLSRTQANPERTPVDLNAAIKEVSLLISAQTKIRRIILESSLADKLPAVMANKNQVQQMILNLANNAMDAMPNGGTLRFTSERRASPSQATLRVDDSGSGMTAEIKAKIFEPFFTTKGEGKGTGLGLALVFDLVHQHAGEIEVESTVGRGTSFTVHLPFATL